MDCSGFYAKIVLAIQRKNEQCLQNGLTVTVTCSLMILESWYDDVDSLNFNVLIIQ